MIRLRGSFVTSSRHPSSNYYRYIYCRMANTILIVPGNYNHKRKPKCLHIKAAPAPHDPRRVPFSGTMNTFKVASPWTASASSKTLRYLTEWFEHPTSPVDGILAAIARYETFWAAVGSRKGLSAVTASIAPLTAAVALAKKAVGWDNYFGSFGFVLITFGGLCISGSFSFCSCFGSHCIVLVLSRDTHVYRIYVVLDFWFSSWIDVFVSTRINVVNVALLYIKNDAILIPSSFYPKIRVPLNIGPSCIYVLVRL